MRLTERIERYASNEIRFNLLAIVQNIKEKATRQIEKLQAESGAIARKLTLVASGAGKVRAKTQM